MKLRRDVILFSAVAVAALVAGWWVLTRRPGIATESFQADLRQLQAVQKPRPPSAQSFRATICADDPCIVVEVGGLTFLFGAGAGAADGVARLGLMQSDLDGVVLPDLMVGSVAGLPAIAEARARAGRMEPLKVFAPSGAVPVIDGANLMASGGSAVRIVIAAEGEDQLEAGKVVFDSGVVTIRGFGGTDRGEGRTYRVDFDGKALLLAGCLADSEDIRAAARLGSVTAAILTVRDSRLAPDDGTNCLDLPEAEKALRQAQSSLSLLIQSGPGAGLPSAAAAWDEAIARYGGLDLITGRDRLGIDLSGATPRSFGAN